METPSIAEMRNLENEEEEEALKVQSKKAAPTPKKAPAPNNNNNASSENKAPKKKPKPIAKEIPPPHDDEKDFSKNAMLANAEDREDFSKPSPTMSMTKFLQNTYSSSSSHKKQPGSAFSSNLKSLLQTNSDHPDEMKTAKTGKEYMSVFAASSSIIENDDRAKDDEKSESGDSSDHGGDDDDDDETQKGEEDDGDEISPRHDDDGDTINANRSSSSSGTSDSSSSTSGRKEEEEEENEENCEIMHPALSLFNATSSCTPATAATITTTTTTTTTIQQENASFKKGSSFHFSKEEQTTSKDTDGAHATVHKLIVVISGLANPTHEDLDEFEKRNCLPTLQGICYPTSIDKPDEMDRQAEIIRILISLYDRVSAMARMRNVPPDDIYKNELWQINLNTIE